MMGTGLSTDHGDHTDGGGNYLDGTAMSTAALTADLSDDTDGRPIVRCKEIDSTNWAMRELITWRSEPRT